MLFHSILRYQHLVEIVIGTDARLGKIDTVINIWAKESERVGDASAIDILYVSLDDKKVRHRRTTYSHSNSRLSRR